MGGINACNAIERRLPRAELSSHPRGKKNSTSVQASNTSTPPAYSSAPTGGGGWAVDAIDRSDSLASGNWHCQGGGPCPSLVASLVGMEGPGPEFWGETDNRERETERETCVRA